MSGVYREFGLTDSEIDLIAGAAMKRDYFYTSPAGRRLFQLDLGPLTLALIGAPDHALLDSLASRYEPGAALCGEILAAKGLGCGRFLDEGAPVGPAPSPRKKPAAVHLTPQAEAPAREDAQDAAAPSKSPPFLEAVASLPDRKNGGGSGRAAAAVAELYKVSVSTVYQARAVLRHGPPELADALRRGDIPVKTAYKRLLKERGRSIGQAG